MRTITKEQKRRWMANFRKKHPDRDKRVRTLSRQNRMARAREILKALKAVPCVDCDNSFPQYVMEFDHTRGVKQFTVGLSLTFKSWSRFWAEVDKCDVVCANCHSIRTHVRRQGGTCRN